MHSIFYYEYMDTTSHRKNLGFLTDTAWQSSPATLDTNTLTIHGHAIMERWETPYMQMLADIVTRNGGHILELGFGMGISAGFIQSHDIISHTIVDFHPDVIATAQKTYATELQTGRVKLLKGLWQEVTKHLPDASFDGIFFDTYPLHEEEMHKNHFWFFPEAYRLLKPGGIFTYYSDEATDFSPEHLQKLHDAGFTHIEHMICDVEPPKDCMYWQAKTLLAPMVQK